MVGSVQIIGKFIFKASPPLELPDHYLPTMYNNLPKSHSHEKLFLEKNPPSPYLRTQTHGNDFQKILTTWKYA